MGCSAGSPPPPAGPHLPHKTRRAKGAWEDAPGEDETCRRGEMLWGDEGASSTVGPPHAGTPCSVTGPHQHLQWVSQGGCRAWGDAEGGVGALSSLGHGCCIRVNGGWGAGGTQEATPKSSCQERAEAGRRFGGLGHVPAAPWRMVALGCHGVGPQSRDPDGAGPRSRDPPQSRTMEQGPPWSRTTEQGPP